MQLKPRQLPSNLNVFAAPQAGFAASGAETSTQFPEINLQEKVSILSVISYLK